jgi:hypothetical protein
LKDGILYNTKWKISLTRDLQVSIHSLNGVRPYNTNRSPNPFLGYEPEIKRLVTPYEKLPLTPELQERRWKEWRKKDSRKKVFLRLSPFTRDQTEYFYEKFEVETADVNPKNYANYEEYLNVLEEVILDNTNLVHEQIVALAAMTSFDKDLGLKSTPDSIKIRKNFFFDSLRAERQDLLKNLGLDASDLPRAPAIAIASTSATSTHISDEDAEDDDIRQAKQLSLLEQGRPSVHSANDDDDDEIRMAKELSLDYHEQRPSPGFVDVLDVEYDDDYYYFVNQSESSISGSWNDDETEVSAAPTSTSPRQDDRELQEAVDQSLLVAIQEAVKEGVSKYQNWYAGDELRGPNGFFSWLRHGQAGQQKALAFNREMECLTDKVSAITSINALLMQPSTRYHRHSLASFLLDELKQIEGTPWHNLKMNDKSMRYDQEVIKWLIIRGGVANNPSE